MDISNYHRSKRTPSCSLKKKDAAVFEMLGMLPWRLDHITTAVTAACDMVRAVGGSDCAAVYRRLYFPATITVVRPTARIETSTFSSALLSVVDKAFRGH
jgi:hypothetical protein